MHGYIRGLTLCCSLGSEHICKELLAVTHQSLQKTESTLQKDIESDSGWYQEERSPKVKTPNAALLQRWLLVCFLSFTCFSGRVGFYPLAVTVPSTRWHSRSQKGISQPCIRGPFRNQYVLVTSCLATYCFLLCDIPGVLLNDTWRKKTTSSGDLEGRE